MDLNKHSTVCVIFFTACLLFIGSAVEAFAQEKDKSQTDESQADRAIERVIKNWLKRDSNSDGKIAKSELANWQKRFFDQADANKDGFLDRKELKPLAKRFQANNRNSRRKFKPISDQQFEKMLPDNVKLSPNIVYRTGHERWKLDLLTPTEKSEKPRAAIFFVHGGGWQSGDKRKMNFLTPAIEFAKEGYVCVLVNYRLMPEVPIKEIVGDVKCAVRWLRGHADKYSVDPQRFGAYGNSAGAHLVCMLGLCKKEANLEGDGPWQEHSSMVQAVCASATPTSFLISINNRSGKRPLQKSSDEDEEKERKAISPVAYAASDAPPMLLFHDTSDQTVLVKQSKVLAEAMKKANAKDFTLKIYDNKSGHGVMQRNIKETGPMRKKFFDRILKATDQK